MTKLHYEIREYAEGFGEGLWLFLNDGLCRGYTVESLETLGLTADDVRHQFRNEVKFFGGTLTDVENDIYL